MIEKQDKWAHLRISIIRFAFALFFMCVVIRVFWLQILQHDDLGKKADRQHQHIVQLTPARGTIMDRNGAPLAESINMDSCYAEPRNIKDPDGTAGVLAPILGIHKSELLKKLSGNKGFVWIARWLPTDKAARIKSMKLPGVGFAPESKRFYPNLEIAAHVIGFTGNDPNGLEGIELKYNSTILGNTGYIVTERDALGRNIAVKGTFIKNASAGRNVVLTLDKTIQFMTEKELAKAVIESGAKAGMALVMESDTGRILAMANYPTFNPNSSSRYSHANLRNRSVADSFEPGSTFKVFVIASALEEQIINPNDTFNCENGVYKIADHTIHDDHPHSRLNVSEIIKYSSNIGAAKIGFKLGEERLNRYLRDFGFGVRTGIDLPGESPGSMKSRSYGIDIATTSFGQGISVSALQMVTAMSAIANGGTLMKPYLVEKVLDDNDVVIQKTEPQAIRRVVSGETARKIAKMMESVTAEGGTGTKAFIDGFQVAGKTGTAQKVDPITHAYSPSKRIGSFVGFVPADKPKLTIAVIIDEPQGVKYGGIVAAPAFRGIAVNALAYMNVLPKGSVNKVGKVLDSSPPPAPSIVATAENTVVNTGGTLGVMPNFKGMSMRTVMQVMEKQGINIKLIGSGRAVEQSPPPGHAIRGTGEVWVRFVPSA